MLVRACFIAMFAMTVLWGIAPAHAQSSTKFITLPTDFVPGESIIPDPAAQAEANSRAGLGSSAPTLMTRVPHQSMFSTKDFQVEYSLIMLGLQQESQYESFQIYSFRIYSTMRYRVMDDLILWFEPYLIFRTGAEQTMAGHSRSGTLLIPKDASLIWTPYKWWQLRGGILDENFNHSFLMLEDQAFPALRTTFYMGSPDAGASVMGEQSVLVFSSDTNNSNQIEKTPTLEAGSFETHYKLSRRNQIKLSGGYWQYDNLPSSLAAEAALNGNTVTRTSDTFSVFAYQFHGYEGRARLELGLGPLDWSLYSEGLYNTGAPSGMNTAWSAGNELLYYGVKNRKYGLNFEYFHVEPDAAISSYNNVEFDRSNRNGIMVMPYFKWGKKQNKLSLRYVTSSLIYNNAPQSDTSQIRLRWETDYDVL